MTADIILNMHGIGWGMLLETKNQKLYKCYYCSVTGMRRLAPAELGMLQAEEGPYVPKLQLPKEEKVATHNII